LGDSPTLLPPVSDKPVLTTNELLFEKPKPEILLIRAMEVSKFETAGTGHSSRLGLIKEHSNPRIMPDREPFLPDANILRRKLSATQHLELE
jgi:hypothetical protein